MSKQERSVAIEGIEFVKELAGVGEYRLTNNDLTILLAADTSVPVAGVIVTYRVGSRNEAIGYTGATHLLEHLLFKSTEKFNHELGTSMEMMLESRGAIINASTSFDRTDYVQVLPSNQLNLALEIEGDRMRTARIIESDRVSEMPTVRNEYEMTLNEPVQALQMDIWSSAFKAHPYHHPIIGWKSDFETVSIERLKQFYDEFYWPDNATVTIVGDFNTLEVLETVKKYFGVHSKSPHPGASYFTQEPVQQGPRRVELHRTGNPVVGVAHKIPAALHEDMPALLLLTSILYENKASRLYKAFIDTALATDIAVSCNENRDASLFEVYLLLASTTSHAKAEAVLLKEFKKLADDGITSEELAAAKRSARIHMSRRRDGPYALLSVISEDIAVGDWSRFATLPEALQKATAEDIQRVVQTYFVPDQSTTGWFVQTTQ